MICSIVIRYFCLVAFFQNSCPGMDRDKAACINGRCPVLYLSVLRYPMSLLLPNPHTDTNTQTHTQPEARYAAAAPPSSTDCENAMCLCVGKLPPVLFPTNVAKESNLSRNQRKRPSPACLQLPLPFPPLQFSTSRIVRRRRSHCTEAAAIKTPGILFSSGRDQITPLGPFIYLGTSSPAAKHPH